MTTLVDRVRHARSNFVREEYAHEVHRAVQEELRRTASSPHVEATGYFNHTAIPDFVLTWPDSKIERSLYLRGSYEAVLAMEDVSEASQEPAIFLGLNQPHGEVVESESAPEALKERARRASAAMVTDVAALSSTADAADDNAFARGPLGDLISSNILRGGRGLWDAETYRSFEKPASSLETLAESLFVPEVSSKIARTARIVDAFLDADAGRTTGAALGEVIGGSLAPDEISALLPWLLANHPDSDSTIWALLASVTKLSDLESVAHVFEDVDLTPLAEAAVSIWRASRAFWGINVDVDDGETSIDERQGWRIGGGRLEFNEGGLRLMFAGDGRHLRGNRKGRTPEWSVFREAFHPHSVVSASLSGITRSFVVDAKGSTSSVMDDVEAVTASLDDTYYVTTAALHLPDPHKDESAARVTADFTSDLVLAHGRDTTIANLFTVARSMANLAGVSGKGAGAAFEVAVDGDEVPVVVERQGMEEQRDSGA